MLQQIADLVEFDLDRFSENQVIEDFNHKFNRAILKIDGAYLKVSHLEARPKGLSLYTFDKKGEEVVIKGANSIEKVLPKTGLYSSPYGLLYLYRLPKRQWIKSLSLGNNYNIHVLATGLKEEMPSIYDTVLVDKPTYDKESVIYKNIVYLHWKKVGKLVHDTIVVTKEKFIEEIKELWNQQYQITLDVKHQPQKAERLIVDF